MIYMKKIMQSSWNPMYIQRSGYTNTQQHHAQILTLTHIFDSIYRAARSKNRPNIRNTIIDFLPSNDKFREFSMNKTFVSFQLYYTKSMAMAIADSLFIEYSSSLQSVVQSSSTVNSKPFDGNHFATIEIPRKILFTKIVRHKNT